VAERNENGQFAKGNGGGPGRPRLDAEQKYLRTLHRSLLQRDVREIVKKLIGKAKTGNIQAAKVLLEYAIGKPTQYVSADVSGEGMLKVTYVNDWRPNNPTVPAQGPADSEAPGEALQLAGSGAQVAQDNGGHVNSGGEGS